MLRPQGKSLSRNQHRRRYLSGVFSRVKDRQSFVEVGNLEYRGCVSTCRYDTFFPAPGFNCEWRGKVFYEGHVYNLVFRRSSETNGVREQHWRDWGRFKALCAKAVRCHLAGEPLQPLDRQCGKAAHCKRMEQSRNIRTCSREGNLIAWRSIRKHWGDPFLKATWQCHRVKLCLGCLYQCTFIRCY